LENEGRGIAGDFWIGVGFYFISGFVAVLIAWVPGMILSGLTGFRLVKTVAGLTYLALLVWMIVWARRKQRPSIIKGYFAVFLVTALFRVAFLGYIWLSLHTGVNGIHG